MYNVSNIVARLQQQYSVFELKTKAEIYTNAQLRAFLRSKREGADVDVLPQEAEKVRAAINAL